MPSSRQQLLEPYEQSFSAGQEMAIPASGLEGSIIMEVLSIRQLWWNLASFFIRNGISLLRKILASASVCL